MKNTMKILMIAICFFGIVGVFLIAEKLKKEPEPNQITDLGILDSPMFIINNCSLKQYGIVIDLNESMTKEQRQGYIYGWVSGLVSNYDRNETTPILTITIGSEECNNRTYTKDYWNISDFTGEDDCIEEGLCFIKYGESEKINTGDLRVCKHFTKTPDEPCEEWSD